ncbi:hypothetical protein M9Y10_023553 [Tritrichomonas musculus]|uniref:Uncharacterized protein n=1 Tax=Tritrichomonas musculus TaxID=1915356 RepID=A0ABR2KWH8_9EUKA
MKVAFFYIDTKNINNNKSGNDSNDCKNDDGSNDGSDDCLSGCDNLDERRKVFCDAIVKIKFHGISNSVKDEEICNVFIKCKISSVKFDLRCLFVSANLIFESPEGDKKIMESISSFYMRKKPVKIVFNDSQIKKSKFQKNEKNPNHEPIVNQRKSQIAQVNCEFGLNQFDLE